jgi:hypothetical protein
MEWMKTNDAGGGAFKLERWIPGQETAFIRPLPKIRRVVLREVPASRKRRALMERGDADLPVDMPFNDAAEIKKSGAYRVVGTPVENSLQYVGLVTKMKPFDDGRVRQAIAWAVPYEEIYKSVVYDVCIPMSGGPANMPVQAVWPQPPLQAGHGKSEGAAGRGRLRRRLRDDDLDRSWRCHTIRADRGAAAELARRTRHQDADRKNPGRQFPQRHAGKEPGNSYCQLWRMAEFSRLFFLLGLSRPKRAVQHDVLPEPGIGYDWSDDMEFMEIIMPGDFATTEITAPAAAATLSPASR